jgi:uncharacterized protein YggE
MCLSPASRLAGAALLVAVFTAPPAAFAADAARTITVAASGEARGAPDQANLSAGVTTTAATANEAVGMNAHKMTAVFDALKRLGIADKDIQTSNFSVQPQMSPYNQNGGAQHIVGYQVSNEVDVSLDDTKKLGAALDALVGAGANQINSVGFSIQNADELEAKAQEAAIARARARAETYARAAGVSLGSVVSISEASAEAPRPVFRALAGMVAAPSPTPTAAGELSVSANVTVVFAIQ